MAALPESPPHTACRLHIDYRDVPAATALATPGTLAVFGFGANAPATPTDPRYLQVALPALGRAPLECWQVDADVAYGREGGIAWAQGGGLQFGALEIADDGDVEAAAAHAYTCLRDWLASSAYAHPLRIWNYLDAITEGGGDAERYRRFCVGRAHGIGRALAPGELPAATAIGHPHRTGRLQLYWLAAEQAGTALENPRQVQAWRYPRQYGPQPPGFARALLPPASTLPLLLSGTAAVVGHASQHADSLDAQLAEILTNIDSLIATARMQRPSLPPSLGIGTRIKVYVRDAEALPLVDALLAARLPTVPRIVLHGHVCRQELLVEIDGCHA